MNIDWHWKRLHLVIPCIGILIDDFAVVVVCSGHKMMWMHKQKSYVKWLNANNSAKTSKNSHLLKNNLSKHVSCKLNFHYFYICEISFLFIVHFICVHFYGIKIVGVQTNCTTKQKYKREYIKYFLSLLFKYFRLGRKR